MKPFLILIITVAVLILAMLIFVSASVGYYMGAESVRQALITAEDNCGVKIFYSCKDIAN